MNKFNKTFFFNDNQVKKKEITLTLVKKLQKPLGRRCSKNFQKKLYFFGLRIPFFYKMGRFK